ncbi:MAG: rhodanese-like domain-containing protein [Candidatus Baltobacteraceae bacterium]
MEVEWLLGHLGEPRLRIVDARSTAHGGTTAGASGAQQYAAGHISGAVHLDYATDLVDAATPYATRVAPPEAFARALGERGIGDDATIVAYDAGDVPFAARFLWMCRYYGHDDVAVLAGGFPAWREAGGAVDRRIPGFPAATFTPRVRPELRATKDEVLAIARGESRAQLLETQRDGTYAQRDRDLPGSLRLSGSRLLEDARGGRIAPGDTIDALTVELGLDRARRTIVSCGSGVAAAGSYLALTENGFDNVAVYDGSWLEWSHDQLPTVPKPKGRV